MKSSESARQAGSGPPVGIDLGTTYSLLAYLDPSGRPLTLPNALGDVLTPSAVIVDEDEIVVGKEAVKASTFTPDQYAECFKRDMGQQVCRRPLNGHRVPPEVLSALVLQRLKHDAERRLGPLKQAVITVPAYFDELRRQATQHAGRLAGWEVLDIINEPTAAALSCGWERGLFGLRGTAGCDPPERALIYDLGGGTFDVSVLEIDGMTLRTLATDGDVRLGGKDFDQCLLDHLAEQFLSARGLDPRSDPQDTAQLWRDAQDVKHALTEHKKARVFCCHAGIRMRLEVTREEFESLTLHLLQRTEDTANLVVTQAGLTWSQIDRVLVVGGATRMPMVGRMLNRLTGKEPDRSISPDEAVAHGAALYAGMLVNPDDADGKRSCQLINVNSHSLGVVGIDEEIGRHVNAVLIRRNTPIPAQVTKTFRTFEESQRSVVVPVVEGESERPEFCTSLGKCVVRGLPPGLPKGTLVEVTYHYANNGRLSVSARVPSTGQSAEVEIHRTHSAVEEDLATWRKKLLHPAGSPPIPPAPTLKQPAAQVDKSDRASIIRRLDLLYTRIGQKALDLEVPARCEASQHAAAIALKELERARQTVVEVLQRQATARGSSDAVRIGVEVSQSRLGERQAAINSTFAFLVLGRDAAGTGLCPPGAEADLEEALALRQRLK